MKRLILWAPLSLFALFVLAMLFSLRHPADTTIRSHLIGKALPAFALGQAVPEKPGLDSAGFADGKPRILNIFASWCIPCMAEAPQLEQIARRGIPIDAIAIRDRPEDVRAFLDRWGDPFQRVGSDTTSKVQLALGSSGVPESFVIDGRGVIRYQHIGEIRPEHVPQIVRAYEAAR
ncbi:MAG TPA: DsbE family thiol:disulfide interchange protein [Allosphingosinicella sp.]|nr:DsbE family thiol:disulfide interchange protein [Allosphingosinicella sp.]